MIVIKIELNVLSENEDCVWLTDMSYLDIEAIKRANPTFNDSQLRDYIREIWPDTYYIRRIDKKSDHKSVHQAIRDLLPIQPKSIESVHNIEYRDIKCQFNTF